MAVARSVLYIDSSPKVGGGQVSLLALLSRIDRARYQPLLATPPGSGVESLAAHLGVETVPLAIASRTALRTGMREGRFRGWPQEPGRLVRASLDMRRWIRGRNVALVHANTTLAGIVATFATRPGRIPVVFHHRVLSALRGPGRIAVDGATRIICVSEAVRASLGRLPERTRVIYDGVDLDAFDAAGEEAAGAVDHGVLRVVTLGRLSPEKGQDLFLEAAREVAPRVPGARFILAGEPFRPGDTLFEARLRSMAASPPLTGRVDFTGFHAEVPRLLAGAALVCVPSRREGLGIAALEAMAARRAVVASAVGGLRETIVPDETGVLVPPEDPRRFGAAVTALLEDSERRERLGEMGRRRVAERFTHAVMARDVTALFDELTGG